MWATRLLRWGIGTAAGLVALGAVGGCGMSSGITVVGANPGGDGGGRSVAVVASAPASVDAEPIAEPAAASATITTSRACATADLRLQVLKSSQSTPSNYGGTTIPISPGLLARQTTRTQQLTLVFTNVSHSACTMRGYPSVDFLRAGVHGPLSAPNSFARSPGATDVRLTPGKTADSQITFTTNSAANSRGRRCDEVVAVRIYPPGSTKALTANLHDSTNHHIPHFYVCGHKVVVRAVQPK